MPRFVGKLTGVLIVLLFIGGPFVWSLYLQSTTRNFRPVREGVLYRSGQMTVGGLKRVINDHGIKTVISLRDSHDPNLPPPDLAEEQFCKHMEVNYHRLPPRQWEAAKGEPIPVDENVRKFISILSDPRNHPVLVHCFAGIHRAGAYSAIYRMEFEGWSNDEAIAELMALGYTNLSDHRDIQGYMQKYEPSWRQRTQVLPGRKP